MNQATDHRHVLVIDDQRGMHEAFDRILQTTLRGVSDGDGCDGEYPAIEAAGDGGLARGYQLQHADSGEAGIIAARRAARSGRPFSVAFVDMCLPGIDGVETTERLWQVDPELHVVIYTTFSDHDWADVVKRLGRTDRLLLLKKPFERDEVRQLALAFSEKARLAGQHRAYIQQLRREVAHRQQIEADLRWMAQRDALTSLPNREFLLHRLQLSLDRRRRAPAGHDAVLFLDLDNFKIVNDSLGHNAGDDLLRQVAARLQHCVRGTDLAVQDAAGQTVRLGGDEFVVLLEQLASREDALVVARRVVQRLAEPFTLAGRRVTIGSSVGVAFVDSAAATPAELLRNADTAMYRAKTEGKGRLAVFDQGMHEAVCARLELESDLRRAMEAEEFSLRFQPVIDLRDGCIRAVETLLRWQQAGQWEVPPCDFIPIAEEIGLITEIGYWVAQQASQQLRDLMRHLPAQHAFAPDLCINMSQRQLADPNLVQRLNDIMRASGWSRQRLKLEITESVALGDPQRTSEPLLRLHREGYRIHMDDFGIGYSSLACFHRFPIEAVKIDRALVASIDSNRSYLAIVQAVIQLAHSLGSEVVAEGLETPAHVRMLKDLGCDRGQGFIFSPPLTIDALADLLLAQTPQQRLATMAAPASG